MAKLTLAFIAEQLNAQLVGDATALISAVGTLEEATSHQISFLSNSKYRKFLQSTQAGAVLIKADDLSYCPVNALVVNDPYVAFAKIAQLLDSTPAAAYGRAEYSDRPFSFCTRFSRYRSQRGDFRWCRDRRERTNWRGLFYW